MCWLYSFHTDFNDKILGFLKRAKQNYVILFYFFNGQRSSRLITCKQVPTAFSTHHLPHCTFLLEMRYTWQMLRWTRQSLRRNCRYNLLQMRNEGGGSPTTTFLSFLTAAVNVSLGGGALWKGGSDCYSSLVTCLFLFTPSVLLFQHNFILQATIVCLELVCLYIQIWPSLTCNKFTPFRTRPGNVVWYHQNNFQYWKKNWDIPSQISWF